MPTYEYQCKKCGIHFERFQSITAEPLKRCPECKGAVRRLIGSGAGILFKGGGFYQTDYRSSSYVAGSKAEKGKSSSETPSSSSSSTTSKPEKISATTPKKKEGAA